MERKQGFFSARKEDVVRGLSPGKSWAKSPARSGSTKSSLLRRTKNYHVAQPEQLVLRSEGSRPTEALSPLKEGPIDSGSIDSKMEAKWGHWVKGQLCRAPPSVSCPINKLTDLKKLLGVLGAPLHVSTDDSMPHLSDKDTPIESSPAQYILQQYTAASGGQKLQNSIFNSYVMGRVKLIAAKSPWLNKSKNKAR